MRMNLHACLCPECLDQEKPVCFLEEPCQSCEACQEDQASEAQERFDQMKSLGYL